MFKRYNLKQEQSGNSILTAMVAPAGIEGWKPYDRDAYKTKQEWVEVAGEFIVAWYQ